MAQRLIVDSKFGTQDALVQVWETAQDDEDHPLYTMQVTGPARRLDLLDLAIWMFDEMDKTLRSHEQELHDANRNSEEPLDDTLPSFFTPFTNSLSLAPPQTPSSDLPDRVVGERAAARSKEIAAGFQALAEKLQATLDEAPLSPSVEKPSAFDAEEVGQNR